MKLKTLDQIHISSVSSETLAPKTEFTVSDVVGEELIKKHPGTIELVSRDKPESKVEKPIANKAEGAAPSNKSEPKAPAAKGSESPKTKGE